MNKKLKHIQIYQQIEDFVSKYGWNSKPFLIFDKNILNFLLFPDIAEFGEFQTFLDFPDIPELSGHPEKKIQSLDYLQVLLNEVRLSEVRLFSETSDKDYFLHFWFG